MVEGKTKSGIDFTINEAISEDMRAVMLMAEMKKAAKEKKDPMDILGALNDLLDLIFGDGKMAFMNAVAQTHGGVCSAESMMSELTEIFDAVKAKNS